MSQRRSIALDHRFAEICILKEIHRGTGVVRNDSAMFGCEAKGQRDFKLCEGCHLLIEPVHCARSKTVSPAKACSQVTHAQSAQPPDCIVKSVVLEMEPLADSKLRSARFEAAARRFWGAILAEQPHVEMPVVRRSLCFPVTCGRLPSAREII